MKLVTTYRIRNHLLLEPDHDTTKWFSGNLLAIERIKTEGKLNNPVYSGLPILDISTIVMHGIGMTT